MKKWSIISDAGQMQGDSNWDKVCQEVTCAICLKLLDDPKSMPCLHTYCKKCIMKALAKRPHDPDLSRDRPAINCPLCRAEVTLPDEGIEALPTDFSSIRLVTTVRLHQKLEQHKTPLCDGCKKSDAFAISSCCDCRGFFLCASCVSVHKNVPATKYHALMTLKDLSASRASIATASTFPHCQKHTDEQLRLYCEECEVLVCRDCVLVQHKYDNYSFVDDLIEDEKKQLKDVTLQELDKILTSTTEAITEAEEMRAKVLSSNDRHIAHLNQTFQEIANMMARRKKFLSDEINQMTEDTLALLQKQQDILTTLKANIEKCSEFTSSTLQNGTNSEIMSARKQILERSQHLKKLHDTKLSPVAKPTKTILYQLSKLNKEIDQIAIFVDLHQCCVHDMPEQAFENEEVTLRLMLKDTEGQPICDATSSVTARVTTATNKTVTPSVKELRNGKYLVKFTPVTPAKHQVSIQINSLDISKSPMEIPCLQVVFLDVESSDDCEEDTVCKVPLSQKKKAPCLGISKSPSASYSRTHSLKPGKRKL